MLPWTALLTVRWLESALGRRPRVGCRAFLDDHRSNASSLSQGASLLSGRTHDPRWLRLHPQLLGADASGGWTEWIEDVDVALADAPGAPDLAPAVEARIDLVADGESGTCAQTAQHGGARRQREVGVVVDGQRIALAEAVAGEVLARDLRTIEECLHAQPEQLVLVAQ